MYVYFDGFFLFCFLLLLCVVQQQFGLHLLEVLPPNNPKTYLTIGA